MQITRVSLRRALAAALAAALLCAEAGAGQPALPGGKLDFVVILVDDLGSTDFGCTGSDFHETPAIDRLAREGVRFTDAYSACTVCSPTRASLLTGKYPARLHVTDWIPGHVRPRAKLKVPDWTMHLPHGEVTLAEALKGAGYATASIGKWHLGGKESWPESHGFDVNKGGCDKGQPPSYFSPYRIPTLEDGPPGEYLTDRETAEACRFMEAHAAGPFFLYLPHHCVHTPLQAKKDFIRESAARVKPELRHKNPTYAAMIRSLDESVARILAKLDELNIKDRTAIFLTSDNGGLLGGAKSPITTNVPLRAGKGSSYEGGVRVPLIVKWPGVTRAGGVCLEPVVTVDFYPTILEMAGVSCEAVHAKTLDGTSLVPLLRDPGARLGRDSIFWHYPHYHPGGATPYGAIRERDWKLIEFYEGMRVELYNLAEDIGEKRDLAAEKPEKTEALRKKLHEWRERVGAQMPAPNPAWDGGPAESRGSAEGPARTPAEAAAPESGEWKLVFEDRFERKDLGPDWFIRSGRAEIHRGRLFVSGAGATVLVSRAFAPDVKLEFEAEANPELPPCDLSAALGSSEFWGYEYLLAFGGNNNQLHQIKGGSAATVDRSPAFLIEHGKTYKLAAVKEGRRLSYHVGGVKILEGEDSDPVGGPGFDRVGLVTWNGMYADNVKVYERASPAPGGPRILAAFPDLGYRWEKRKLQFQGEPSGAVKRGLDAYNAGRLREAFEAFGAESPPTLASAAGMAYVAGDLAFGETPEARARLAEIAAGIARDSPGDGKARDFARACEWFQRITIQSRDRRAVTRLFMAGPENNPFYHKANFFRARYHHAWALEGADAKRKKEALDIFASLREIWPEVLALREFAGEAVPWGPELIRPESAGPAWARHLEECLARQHAILRWWFTERQAADGQLGGGWGDDVEILRSWVPVAAISTAGETAVAGIEKLAGGVWTHVLKDGYVPEPGDVEHNAEPGGDALPGMILLRHGDPRYVEWNLRAAKTIREKFLAANERGRLQFRSAEFGTDGVSEHPGAGGDTGYHARAMRHFVWLAWYGIPEAQEVFLRWCDTWREAAMEARGTKPAGFVPASIFFPSGSIEPPGGRPWHDPAAHYYGFPGITDKIHDSFLTASWLSGDSRFLEPVEEMLDLAATGPLATEDPTLPPDHPRNLLAHVSHQAGRDVLAVHRWITGRRAHEAWLLARGSATQRFFVDGDLDALARSFERLAGSLRVGWTQRTSEVLQTDRAGLPGAAEVLGATTGAVRDFRDTGAPTMAVTWDTRDLHFAAVVTDATSRSLRLRVFRFGEGTERMGLRPWRLVPGAYILRAGEPLPARPGEPERCAWRDPVEVTHLHKGAPIRVDVPAGKEVVVDLRLRREIPRPRWLPDLAIARRDIRAEGPALRVTVHNIGGRAAGAFSVTCEGLEASGALELSRARLGGLPAPAGFEPVAREVELQLPAGTSSARLRVALDPEGAVDEVCELNNEVSVGFDP